MLQNINLYLPEFRKKKDWLSAQNMLLSAGVTLGVLVVLSAWDYWQTQRLQTEFEARESARAAAVAATNDLIDRYGVQTEDPVLLASIERMEESLQEKQDLLQFLEGRELGNASGFSEYLADLSRFHIRGLSLTHVSLSDGGNSVHLSGQVLKAELVPLYLQSLSKGRSFSGKDFSTLQIQDIPADTEAGLPPVWVFEVGSLNVTRD